MLTFKVTQDGGEEYDLTADSRDVYVWEKSNKGSSFAQLMNDMHMVDLYKLAHIAAKRQDRFDGPLQEFAETHVLDVDTDDEEEDGEDPTRPAASAGP